MKLITYCKSCRHANRIDDKGIVLRGDLEEKHGLEIEYECEKCLDRGIAHPNQVYARTSKIPLLICSLLGLLFIVLGIILNRTIGTGLIVLLSIGGVILTAGFISGSSSTTAAFNKSIVR